MAHCSQPIRRAVLSDRGTRRFRVTGRWFAYRAEMVFGDCHCVFVGENEKPFTMICQALGAWWGGGGLVVGALEDLEQVDSFVYPISFRRYILDRPTFSLVIMGDSPWVQLSNSFCVRYFEKFRLRLRSLTVTNPFSRQIAAAAENSRCVSAVCLLRTRPARLQPW